MSRSAAKSKYSFIGMVNVDFLLLVIFWSLLVSVAAEILPLYIKSVKLVESAFLAGEVRNSMQINRALTGEWPNATAVDVDHKQWPTISSYRISNKANITITLNRTLGLGERNTLGYTQGASEPSEAFQFFIWRCGNSQHPQGYVVEEIAETTVPPFFSRTLCRR